MTRLEMYLTQTTRLNLMRQWDKDKIRSITRRYIEDRTGLFTRGFLFFNCPTNVPGSCYNDCGACWNRFFNEFNEVVDI
ncbi:hypothetical protein H6A05_01965 [Megasphaera elsdenii]|uniref:hypothetical protein n=1 Tax=Megasphaera elsdenii TaxID=907 RepID=UPI001957150F|nr:hypothetical protein [Megasphaera elsdenii]MBM6701092.1 hypothetical protein [Megasphaera elsdenii]